MSRSRIRLTLGIALALLACRSGQAQPSLQNPNAAARVQSRLNAKALFVAGNADSAESTLLAFNANAPDTAEWHLESAQLLATMAFSLRPSGTPALATGIAQRAFDHLVSAESKAPAGNHTLRAQIKYSMGWINERLLGTTTAAKANYQAAVALDSQSRGAVAALARLQKATDEADARRNRKPGSP